jgi:hypothetical protein
MWERCHPVATLIAFSSGANWRQCRASGVFPSRFTRLAARQGRRFVDPLLAAPINAASVQRPQLVHFIPALGVEGGSLIAFRRQRIRLRT